MLIENLPGGQDIFYRVRFRDLSHTAIEGEPVVGRFRTAPADRRDVSFVWGGDVAGQGWGINPDDGGMFTFSAMRKHRPDFFLHSGDTIYADGSIAVRGEARRRQDSGRTSPSPKRPRSPRRSTSTAPRTNTISLDDNVRAFNAEVPIFVQWDDHEVTNNWSLSKELPAAYKERDISLLAARAGRAFHEMYPMRESIVEPGRVYRQISYGPHLDVFVLDERSYRGPNGANLETAYGPDELFSRPGPDRLAQARPSEFACDLEGDRLRHADQPLVVSDTPKGGSEAIAQGDGPVRGREFEIADILRFIKMAPISNTVWLTADVHYAAAHYYDPNKAQFQEFEPFWEFVSGPLHAGTFGPNALDNTFGPEVRFVKAPGKDNQNLPPSAGMQFFGHVKIDGAIRPDDGDLARPRRRRAVVDHARSETGLKPRTLTRSGAAASAARPPALRSNTAFAAAAASGIREQIRSSAP